MHAVVEGKPFAFVSYCDKLSAAWALKALKRKTVAALCGKYPFYYFG